MNFQFHTNDNFNSNEKYVTNFKLRSNINSVQKLLFFPENDLQIIEKALVFKIYNGFGNGLIHFKWPIISLMSDKNVVIYSFKF